MKKNKDDKILDKKGKKSSSSKKSKKSKKKKKKRSRKSSGSSEESESGKEKLKLEELRKLQKLDKLRQERLAREEQERARANHVLYGVPLKEEKQPKDEKELLESRRKYSSQFNPQIAKQNKLDASKKYWLE